MDPLICYCFGYSEHDIIEDARLNGKSVILERIMEQKKDRELPLRFPQPQGSLMSSNCPPGSGQGIVSGRTA